MYIYTYTLIIWVNRRDNFHYVSKSTDWKLCNDLQYVDIVFITLCFYQVDRGNNTQFIYMSPFLLCFCQCICFQYILFTHLALLWLAFDGKMIVNTIVWPNCTKVIGTNWIVSFELNIVWSMKANCCLADVQ